MWAALALFILYLAVLAAGVYEDGMNLFQFVAVFVYLTTSLMDHCPLTA